MLAGAVRERCCYSGCGRKRQPSEERRDAWSATCRFLKEHSYFLFALLKKTKPFWVWIWAAYKVIHLLHQCYFFFSFLKMGRRIISKSFFHSRLSIWSISCDAKTQSTDMEQSWEAPFNARSSRCCHDDEAFQKHVRATPVKNMSLAFINSGNKKKNRIMRREQGVKIKQFSLSILWLHVSHKCI